MPTRVDLPGSHPLAGPIREFLADLGAAGKSPHTVRAYCGDLAKFAVHHIGTPEEVTLSVLRDYNTAISVYAPSTRARKQASIAAFLSWCQRNELTATNPSALLERVKVPEAKPRGVDPGQVNAVLAAIPRNKPRDRVLFMLIARTGVRAGEALGIYIEDITLTPDDEHVTVSGKGGRTRTILLDDPALVTMLRRYLRQTGYTRGPLFRAAKNHVGGPLRYASAQELWAKYNEAAEQDLQLHQLRHTHATELVRDGVSLQTIRKRLGHRRIQTTLGYADHSDKAADNELRDWRRRQTTH